MPPPTTFWRMFFLLRCYVILVCNCKSSSSSVQGSVFSYIDALLGEFRVGVGVHGSCLGRTHADWCSGVIFYFGSSPGIDTR